MIRLTNPLLHDGRIIPAGDLVSLDDEFEQAIVDAGNAVPAEGEVPAPEPEEDPEHEEDGELPDPPGDPEMRLGRAGRAGEG